MSFKKNTSVTGFTVGLVANADGSDVTTGTPVGYYTLDGGTQTAIGDVTPVHEGNGQWSFDLTAGETNGDIVGLVFTHPSAITVHFTIKTDTKITSDLNDIAATEIVSAGAITTLSGAVVNVDSLSGHTPQTGDCYARLGVPAGASIAADLLVIDNFVDELESRLTALRAGYLDNLSGGAVALASVATEARLAELDTANLPANVDSILTDTGTTLENHLTDIKGTGFVKDTNSLPQCLTATGFSTHSAADARAEMDANSTQLATIAQDTGTTLENHLTGIKGGAFDTATDSLEAIRNRGDSAWTTGAGGTPPDLLQNTTIATLTNQTTFTLTAGSSDDSAYADQVAIVTDSATGEQKTVRSISSYTGATKTVVLASAGDFTVSAGDTVDIIAATGAAGSGATAAEVWAYSARALTDKAGFSISGTKTTLDDLNDIAATAIVSSGAITTLSGAVVNVDTVDTTTTNTDTALALATAQLDLDTITGADGVTLATLQGLYAPNKVVPDAAGTAPTVTEITADIDASSSKLAAIVADTDELQGDWTNGGRLDLIIDQILADTGSDGVAISAATANQIADAILMRDMSAVTGEASRSMLNALRFLRNKWSILGTTLTVTKEDDVTDAWTAVVSTDAAADPVTGSDPA